MSPRDEAGRGVRVRGRHRELDDHGEVDGDGVAALHAQREQHAGHPPHLAREEAQTEIEKEH